MNSSGKRNIFMFCDCVFYSGAVAFNLSVDNRKTNLRNVRMTANKKVQTLSVAANVRRNWKGPNTNGEPKNSLTDTHTFSRRLFRPLSLWQSSNATAIDCNVYSTQSIASVIHRFIIAQHKHTKFDPTKSSSVRPN